MGSHKKRKNREHSPLKLKGRKSSLWKYSGRRKISEKQFYLQKTKVWKGKKRSADRSVG